MTLSTTMSGLEPSAAPRGKILVIDADARTRNLTVEYLRRKQYEVDQVASGAEVLARLGQTSYDLIVTEIALPGLGGAELMRRVREVDRELPLVVLTAQPSVETAIAAVRANVVDYLCKPCRADDLLLVVARALEERAQQLKHQHMLNMVAEALEALRQPASKLESLPLDAGRGAVESVSNGNVMDVGVLALDREKRLVTVKTDPPRIVELTEGEASILVALMQKPDQVLTPNQLAKTALGYDGMDKWTVESVVRSSVFRLRNKIEPGLDNPQLIRTVRGRGYFFCTAPQG
jgi:DNA-binding response OmpR family regulator